MQKVQASGGGGGRRKEVRDHVPPENFAILGSLYRLLVSSVDRAPVCRAGGLEFEPPAGPTLRVLK